MNPYYWYTAAVILTTALIGLVFLKLLEASDKRDDRDLKSQYQPRVNNYESVNNDDAA